MPSYHPITVHVVNVATGEPFEEYKVSHNGNDVVCYIESTADTEFRLDIKLAIRSIDTSKQPKRRSTPGGGCEHVKRSSYSASYAIPN
jgi:hypothetical protein